MPAVSQLVPRPLITRSENGVFELKDPVFVVAERDRRVAEIGELLAKLIRERTGFSVHLRAEYAGQPAIVLVTELENDNPEAFQLDASPSGVSINGATSEGVLWGVQTLRQLLPREFYNPNGEQRASWLIPAVEISDEPRYPWRGSLMDVSRHFFSVDFVKRYIDLLSYLKMNVLHWHLTEDQAWRLEIDQYPRLTDIGAWRTEEDGSRYGGFYSKEEVREIVEYARVRGVMVVPEIEMPGHATAALVAYPELACSDPPTEVPNDWGVFPDIYCAGKPETFTFLENVLDEVTELFPSPYIHIGGDEVPKERWRDCEPCQEIIQRENLGDEDGLQAWFIQRIGEHLASRGKTLIGWDEILDGGGVPGS
ncbi:MAG: beta-N-acetylhexosaminidase, partial [Rubricoccaceae bacterium]|nr:beta-N-acetylhexosaminidase [Rubricoccaceae bacterium]